MWKRYSVLWAGLLIWLWGCASVPPTHYYTFRPEVEKPFSSGSSKYAGLSVETLEADEPYQKDKIVFRSSPYEVNFYTYRQWLRPLTELATERIVKSLAAAGIFQQVQYAAPNLSTEYRLRGRIKMFDHWTSADQSEVQVVILYQLSASESDRVIWKETVATKAPIVRAKTADLQVIEIVKGFETALQENILQALTAIDRVLSQPQS